MWNIFRKKMKTAQKKRINVQKQKMKRRKMRTKLLQPEL